MGLPARAHMQVHMQRPQEIPCLPMFCLNQNAVNTAVWKKKKKMFSAGAKDKISKKKEFHEHATGNLEKKFIY